jgi:hypothetical protein
MDRDAAAGRGCGGAGRKDAMRRFLIMGLPRGAAGRPVIGPKAQPSGGAA